MQIEIQNYDEVLLIEMLSEQGVMQTMPKIT